MGKAKKLGLGIGLSILPFLVMYYVGGASLSDTQELQEENGAIEQQKKIETVNDRYYGLTENQIMIVKMIEESCDRTTAEVSVMSGKTASEYYAEKCEQKVLSTIEGYK